MFKIPLPCKMGESTEYKGMEYLLCGVSWFYWSNSGWEFTYNLCKGSNVSWNNIAHILFERDMTISSYINIEETLTEDRPIKEHGFPLTGTGHLYGLRYIKGRLYAEFIITSRFNEHILCECNEDVKYENGLIIFPPTPSYDSEEKRRKAVTSAYLKTHTA